MEGYRSPTPCPWPPLAAACPPPRESTSMVIYPSLCVNIAVIHHLSSILFPQHTTTHNNPILISQTSQETPSFHFSTIRVSTPRALAHNGVIRSRRGIHATGPETLGPNRGEFDIGTLKRASSENITSGPISNTRTSDRREKTC